MLPYNSFYNPLYMGIAYPIILRENPKGFAMKCPLSHFKNLGSIKFGLIVFLATSGCAILALVKKVARACIPSEIFKSIIIANAIIMTCLKAIRAWANKCIKNRLMNIDHNHIIPPMKIDRIISLSAMNRNQYSRCATWLLSLASNKKRADSSKIANLIMRKVWNVSPDFFHFRLLKQKALCGWQLLSGRLPCTRLLNSLYHTQLATVQTICLYHNRTIVSRRTI